MIISLGQGWADSPLGLLEYFDFLDQRIIEKPIDKRG
jgi:hypothetical protein